MKGDISVDNFLAIKPLNILGIKDNFEISQPFVYVMVWQNMFSKYGKNSAESKIY